MSRLDSTDALDVYLALGGNPGEDWMIVRETATATTVERISRTRENGMLTGREIEQLTVFSDGNVLLYIREDHPECPWFGEWHRERNLANILDIVSLPATVNHVDY